MALFLNLFLSCFVGAGLNDDCLLKEDFTLIN